MRLGWLERDTTAFRAEAHYGDRVITCRVGRPQSLIGMMRSATTRKPDGEALVCGTFRVRWRELELLVEACARGLAERNIQAGDRVILFLGNRAEFVILLYALARIGAIAVPVGISEQAPGLAYIAERSGASAIFYEDALADRIPSLPCTISIANDDPHAFVATLDRPGQELPASEPAEEQAALIMFTSGTTGHPKGAIVTHLALVHVAMSYAQCMGLGAEDRSACVVPLSHITGITAMLATIAIAGGTLLVVPKFDAAAFAALAAAERMTHTLLVPTMYNLLIARVDLGALDLSAWRIGAFGGAPMPSPTIERLHELVPTLRLMNCYGATETCGGVVVMPADQVLTHSDAIGWATPGVQILVMNTEGRQVAPGEGGELWIGGPMTTPGYWNDDHASAMNIVGGYWRSGDIGSVDHDGCVRILDRLKDMINRGGYKIYSAEVESVLAAHPGVLEAAVIGTPCSVLGERVHAVVVLEDGAAVTEPGLRAHCATRLTDYKQPESYAFSTEPLPRNANGKILKKALRRPGSIQSP